MTTDSLLFHQISVSYDERLLKRHAEPQSVSITTPRFFKEYYPNIRDWDWTVYFANRDCFYRSIPNPLIGKLWYKGPIDFMDACYLRKGMVACVSEKIRRILMELQVNKEEYILHPIVISKEEALYYILFIPFLSIEELKIDFDNSVFDYALWPNEKLRYFRSKEELYEYLLNRDNPLRTKRLVLDKSLMQRDIINAGFIHGDIYFSNRIIEAFNEEQVIGYQVLQPGSEGTTPLVFSK
jgi:hypothetical protein